MEDVVKEKIIAEIMALSEEDITMASVGMSADRLTFLEFLPVIQEIRKKFPELTIGRLCQKYIDILTANGVKVNRMRPTHMGQWYFEATGERLSSGARYDRLVDRMQKGRKIRAENVKKAGPKRPDSAIPNIPPPGEPVIAPEPIGLDTVSDVDNGVGLDLDGAPATPPDPFGGM